MPRMTALAAVLWALVVCAVASSAVAQTATIAVTHDDPDGVILPGETVRITMRISWTPAVQLAGFAGDLRADPVGPGAPGTISNRFSRFLPSALTINGSVVADDILGIDIASTPGFFTPMVWPPWGSYTGFDAFAHDWTAPSSPGNYRFGFSPRDDRPNVRLYPSWSSPAWIEAPTTYLWASLTVIPGPGSPVVVLLGLAVLHRNTCRSSNRPPVASRIARRGTERKHR